MIEHVTLPVGNYKTPKVFCTSVLFAVGYSIQYDFEGEAIGFMEGGHTSFWIVQKPKIEPTHIAFLAKDKAAVELLYRAAISAGAPDNGALGLWREYSPDYYTAFALDPDWHNIEAVCYS